MINRRSFIGRTLAAVGLSWLVAPSVVKAASGSGGYFRVWHPNSDGTFTYVFCVLVSGQGMGSTGPCKGGLLLEYQGEEFEERHKSIYRVSETPEYSGGYRTTGGPMVVFNDGRCFPLMLNFGVESC